MTDNISMNTLMMTFYNIKLKDYFDMLSTYVDKKYEKEYKGILQYSAADSNYLIHDSKTRANINPDVTIGEMLNIAYKLKASDEYEELEKLPYDQQVMAFIGYRISKSIMVEPFYDLFKTAKGKKALERINNINFKKKEND